MKPEFVSEERAAELARDLKPLGHTIGVARLPDTGAGPFAVVCTETRSVLSRHRNYQVADRAARTAQNQHAAIRAQAAPGLRLSGSQAPPLLEACTDALRRTP